MRFVPYSSHWNVTGGRPTKPELNVTFAPACANRLDGCAVKTGGALASTLTSLVRKASELPADARVKWPKVVTELIVPVTNTLSCESTATPWPISAPPPPALRAQKLLPAEEYATTNTS